MTDAKRVKLQAMDDIMDSDASAIFLRVELDERLKEISDLKTRLSEMEYENSNLKTKIREVEAELRETRTTLGEYVVLANRKPRANSTAPKPLKRARSPSLEIVATRGSQGIQTESEKARYMKVLDDVEMVDLTVSKRLGISSPSKTPEHEKSSQTATEPSTDVTPPSTSSTSVTQSISSPTKKRKIELVESTIPLMNVDQTASERSEGKVVLVPLEEAPSGNNSSALSSASRTTEQLAHAPGPANPVSTHILVPSVALPVPPSVPAQNAEQSPSVTEAPSVKDTLNSQDQVVTQNPSTPEQSQTLPTTTPPIVQPTLSVALATITLTSQLQSEPKTSSPKAKKRKIAKVEKHLSLPESDVNKCLDSATPLLISFPPLELEIPRAFLRVAYGGSDMQFLQYPKQNPSGSRKRRMVFPLLELNPCIPTRPGEPGLIFASRHEILENPPWTLFVKRRKEAPAVWLYLGEYKCTLSGTMTAEQFSSQSPIVQNKWARSLLETKEFDVYVAMRARVALRKAGKIPVDDKETQEALVREEIKAVKSNRETLPVTKEDIVEAFNKGEEGIDIIRMECVEYDHIFANDMQTQFASYPQLLAAYKENLKNKKSSTKRKSGQKAAKAASTPIRQSGASLSSEDHLVERMSSSLAVSSRSTESASALSGVQAEVEGLRRSNRPRSTRLPAPEMSLKSDESDSDDSQSLYNDVDG